MNVDAATKPTRSDTDVVMAERRGRIVEKDVSADCGLAAARADLVSSVYGALCLDDSSE